MTIFVELIDGPDVWYQGFRCKAQIPRFRV